MAERTEEELKELLGGDYESFLEFKQRKDKRAKLAEARAIASAMVTEGGKYYEDYARLDAQLNAIWEKAMREAKDQLGIVED